jgi:hypothetical protein
LINKANNGICGFPFDFFINIFLEMVQTCSGECGQGMMFDIKSIEVVEEFGHPFVHDLMVGPSELQFVEEDGSAL